MSGRIVLIAWQRWPKDKNEGSRVTLSRFLIHPGSRRKWRRREALGALIAVGVAMAHCGRSSFADYEVSRCYPDCAPDAEPLPPTIFTLTAAPLLVGLAATADGAVTVLGAVPATAGPAQVSIAGAMTRAPAAGDGMFLVRRGPNGEASARVDASDSGTLGAASLIADGNRVLTCGYLSGAVTFDGRVLTNPGRQAPLIGVFDDQLAMTDALVMPTTIQNGQCKGLAARDGRLAATGLIGGTIDPGGGVLTASQDPNAFVALYQASDLSPRWQVGLIASTQVYAQVVSIADDGGVYAGGRFEGSVDFAPPALASQGSFDGYIIRYGVAGGYRWSTVVAGAGDELLQRMTTFEGGVCVCGHTGSGVLSLGATTLPTSGDDVFIGCYDDAGSLRWSRTLQAVTAGQCGGAVVASGRLVIAGVVGGGADFGAGPVAVDGTAGFAAAYDAEGALVGARVLDTGTAINGLAVAGETVWASGTFTERLAVDGVSYASDAPNAAFIAPVRLAAP